MAAQSIHLEVLKFLFLLNNPPILSNVTGANNTDESGHLPNEICVNLSRDNN